MKDDHSNPQRPDVARSPSQASSLSADEIRARALDALHQGRFHIADELLEGADVQLAAMVESLRIYQAELQIQNEELLRGQRQTQLALERFTSFFNSLPVAELVVDHHGLVKEANLAAQALFQLRHTHIHQHYFTRLVAEEHRAAVIEGWQGLSRTKSLRLHEIGFRVGESDGFIGDLHVAPLRSINGDLEHYVCAILDRSEEVRQRRHLADTTLRLRQREQDLQERLKEQGALHDVLRETSRTEAPMERVLQRVVDRLPRAWQFPALAEARIRLPDGYFETPGFTPSEWMQSARIELGDDHEAEIQVAYRECPPDVDGSPFLVEEQALLEAIAAHIAVYFERQRDARRLDDSRERYRVLAEYSPDWEYWLGPDGCYRYVSPACAQLTGYQAEDFMADADLVARLIDPADRDVWVRHYTEAISCHAADDESLQLRLRDRDGRERWIEHICNPVIAEDGRFLGRRGVFRDISERKRIESEPIKLSLAVEQSPESIVITDLDGCIQYVNAAFVANSGYAREEVIGGNPRILKSGLTSPEVFEDLWRRIKRGECWNGELINRRKSGEFYIEQASITPIRQPNGDITHYLAVKADVTEQKRLAEELERHRHRLEELVESRTEALRQQSHSLQSLLDNLPHLAWMKDQDGRYVAVNRVFAEMAECEPADLIGLTDRDVWPGELAERYLADDREVMAGRRKKITEEPIGAEPDSLYETFKAPIVDDTGEVLGTVGIARDIRPQREMEAELARRADQAEIAARAKSAFLANMSHEIRTPMNAILGLTHLLRGELNNPTSIDRLNKIESATRHLLTVINDILDLSKIEAGKLHLSHEDFALSSLIDQVCSLIQDEVRAKGLSLSVEIDPALPWMHGDVTRLRQALLNYASNAVKFTHVGGIVVRARLVARESARCLVRFEVEDTGIGVPADKQSRLFQAFEQADTSTTRRYGGTGLGLAITAQLARLMDGEAGAESAEGHGSIFWFTAWLTVGQSSPSAVRAQRPLAEEEMRARCGGARLLLVEDNPINREVVLELLGGLGLRVDTAENGRVALEMAADQGYDLVLMDVQMPVMDGLTATRAIRALPGWRDTPILALTANAFDEDRRNCLEAGMSDFVPKPVEPPHLFDTLLRWLPARAADAAPSGSAPSLAPGASGPGRHRGRDLLAPIRALPGLDLRQGLASLRGSQEKYLALLRRFLDTHAEDPARMSEALAGRDLASIARLAHALKGVAGTLGLVEIAERAKAIDALLRQTDGTPDPAAVAAAIARLDDAFQPLNAALGVPLGACDPSGALADQEQTWRVLDELTQLLREDNARALSFCQLESERLGALMPTHFDELQQLVMRFEFDHALALIALIRKGAVAARP